MPPLRWADLRGRQVAVWGVGVEGHASLARLRAEGVTPLVVDREDGALEDGTEVVGLARGLELMARCDVVVKSPGISRYSDEVRHLTSYDVLVLGGLGLWLNGARHERVLAVTGTKGKSTTTSIAGGLLAGLGLRHRIAGNIGVCPWDPAVDQDVDWWVLEVSSYQATDIELGPYAVAVTSLSEDHVPWHGGEVERYYRDKLSLATRPGVQRVVANGADPKLRERADLLGPEVEWVSAEAAWASDAPLIGAHNRRNAEIARRALQALGVPGLDAEAGLAQALSGFVPLPSRLTAVAERDGVTFVDDSISTNVLSATAAVASFPGRRVALLVGGLERDIDYRPLADAVREGVRVFTMPSNGPAIGLVLRAEGVSEVEDCVSLSEAVARAFAWARPGGVVLLSPAAASFDLFRDYRARGAAFAEAVRALS